MAPKEYKAILKRVFNHLDNTEYSDDHVFPPERIAQLTPEDLMRFFNTEIFETETPTDNARPLKRASTLAFWKKALSFFMTNKLMVWNEIARVGNPTRSVKVNDLVKRLKKAEVRKQGAPSKARRSLTNLEFRKIMRIARERGKNRNWKYGIPALMTYQFHLIARLDDTMNVLRENLDIHPHFDFALKTKLEWSKNINEERDSPWQIVLGAMDNEYCVLLQLALWLEIFYIHYNYSSNSPYLFAFTDDCRIPEGGEINKRHARAIFDDRIYKAEGLTGIIDGDKKGGLGTHSTRKYASSHTRKNGMSKDDKDTRGRWKGKGRVSDVYDDIELPYVDTKVAASLAIGGPCKYKVIDGSVSDVFILTHCATNLKNGVPEKVALVLGKALLYISFADQINTFVPVEISDRIKTAYSQIERRDGDPPLENPVQKVPMIATGREGEVYLDEVIEENGTPATSGTGMITDRGTREQLQAIHSQLASVKYSVNQLKTQVETNEVRNTRYFNTINNNIKRIAVNPRNSIQLQTQAISTSQTTNATLSRSPNTLYELWDEWCHGLGGRKAAKDFNNVERGKVKHKFTRRKIVWDKILILIRSGLSAQVSIDKIYSAYGRHNNITTIINRMRKDRKENYTPPQLRIG